MAMIKMSSRLAVADGRVSARWPQPSRTPQRTVAPPKDACVCGGWCPRCQGLREQMAVSAPGEMLEREAEQAADRVMYQPAGPTGNGSGLGASGTPVPYTPLPSVTVASPVVPVAIGEALRGAYRSLDAATRAFFEPRFGHDFGAVRLHTSEASADSARALNAQAYTIGRDIVFGAGQYAPQTSAGRRLLAHELAHVVQQSGAQANRNVASLFRVLRTPVGTQGSHEDIVEEYREAHGLPSHGIDPITGAPVGPTDQEIRLGGLLEAWIVEKSGAIAAPEAVPTLAGAGSEDVRTGCRKDNKGDENDYHFCRRHREFAVNMFPQAVENIRRVPSPYTEAIYRLYASVLPWMKLLAGATPRRGDSELVASGNPGTLKFGTTALPVPEFSLVLDQKFSDIVAQQRDIGSGIEIWIDESNPDISLQNFPAVESAMVHEAMHAFSKAVQKENITGMSHVLIGLPTRAPVDLNLDPSSYGKLQGDLSNVVLPYVRRIQQLPSQAQGALSARFYAELTASIMIGETIARMEEAIYEKQRAGEGFAPVDLTALPDFYTLSSYWEPEPMVRDDLVNFLVTNREQIRIAVGPIIKEVGARYLNLRPRPSAKAGSTS